MTINAGIKAPESWSGWWQLRRTSSRFPHGVGQVYGWNHIVASIFPLSTVVSFSSTTWVSWSFICQTPPQSLLSGQPNLWQGQRVNLSWARCQKLWEANHSYLLKIEWVENLEKCHCMHISFILSPACFSWLSVCTPVTSSTSLPTYHYPLRFGSSASPTG